mmetsp:Transcript_6178/g.14070  ORF Transcript_6178/g.14070 Transcript_6178/m.14070 type:complete len:203 (-) Transcript_6178:416-1024(-)
MAHHDHEDGLPVVSVGIANRDLLAGERPVLACEDEEVQLHHVCDDLGVCDGQAGQAPHIGASHVVDLRAHLNQLLRGRDVALVVEIREDVADPLVDMRAARGQRLDLRPLLRRKQPLLDHVFSDGIGDLPRDRLEPHQAEACVDPPDDQLLRSLGTVLCSGVAGMSGRWPDPRDGHLGQTHGAPEDGTKHPAVRIVGLRQDK